MTSISNSTANNKTGEQAQFSRSKSLTALERATTGPNNERLSPFILTPAKIRSIDGIEDIARAEVMIKVDGKSNNNANGSGFVISEDGLILTNRHIFSNYNTSQEGILNELNQFPVCITVKQLKAQGNGPVTANDSEQFDSVIADLVAVSDESDLAVLRMRKAPEVKLAINETSSNPAKDTYTISHPHQNLSPIITWGEVMTKAQVEAQEKKSYPLDEDTIYDSKLIYSDNSIDKGSSGSPLLTRDALVMGIVSQKLINPLLQRVTSFSPERYVKDNGEIAVSIKSEDALKFLDQIGIRSEKLSDGKVRAQDQKVIYKSDDSLQDYQTPIKAKIITCNGHVSN